MEGCVSHMGIIKIVLDAFFPRYCLRCGKEGHAMCTPCREAYQPRPPRTTCVFCHAEELQTVCTECRPSVFLDGVIPLTSYGDPIVRGAVTHWKYHGDEAYGDVIRQWIRAGIQRQTFPEAVVTFVPLHISRRRARGFDQAEEVAHAVGGMLGSDVQPLLARRRRTAAQAKRLHGKRLVGDLDHVFEVIRPVPERVLLCDDVFTSGATMDAAAKCLKDAGAKEVWGFVVAKG